MSLFKGIFWYVPDDKRLITVKVSCNKTGKMFHPRNYFSVSRKNVDYEGEWGKLPRCVKNDKPYNYYPRGEVKIEDGQAMIYLHPVLDRFDIHDLILKEFNLTGGSVYVSTCVNHSDPDAYLVDFNPIRCHVCGKYFDCHDYAHNLCMDKEMGYGSSHDLERIQLNLCCDCFDKILDWVLPQCKINPITNWTKEK